MTGVNQSKPGFGVIHKILRFRELEASVDSNKHCSNFGQAEPCVKKLGAVVRHKGHTVTLPDTYFMPVGGRGIDFAIELLVSLCVIAPH
jgi:hypothetical protein